jgi:predicted transcriptional regulator
MEHDLTQSRMEKYLAVIKVLDRGDAITQQQIMRKTGLNLNQSNEYFNFLVRLNLIREETVGSKVVYSLTDKGQRLSAYFASDADNSIFRGTGIFRVDYRSRFKRAL